MIRFDAKRRRIKPLHLLSFICLHSSAEFQSKRGSKPRTRQRRKGFPFGSNFELLELVHLLPFQFLFYADLRIFLREKRVKRVRYNSDMQTEARVGVMMEGGQRALSSGHGGVVSVAPKKQQSLQQSQIGTVSQLLSGGVAGAFSKTCTAPLARLTILFQIQGMHSDVVLLKKASIWHEASRIVREEGMRAFWKGNLVTIAHRLPYSSINFYAYEHYKKLLHMVPGLERRRDRMSADLLVHFLGGGLAGITAASATYPLDLVRTRLAAQTKVIYYEGIWHTLRTICRDEGILGLYKGLGATILGVGPSIAISFSVYESLRSFWQSRRPHDSTVLVSLTCGSLSGIASSTATFPLDLVRRRKQLEGVGGRARVYNTGLLGIFKHILRTEGFRGFYRGILPEYYKVVPGVGICFMTYETLKSLLAADTNARL